MKTILSIGILFTTLFSSGSKIPDDLPKSVYRELKAKFGKENVQLEQVDFCEHGFPGDKLYVIYTRENENPAGYLHLGRVKTCRTGGCSAPGETKAGDDSEYFDYLIVFNTNFAVETIRITNYQASYGHEISARGWLKQFEGFTGKTSLEVGKNIDAISGATVSVHAITDDVQWKTKMLQATVK